jgi:hypothetical protein
MGSLGRGRNPRAIAEFDKRLSKFGPQLRSCAASRGCAPVCTSCTALLALWVLHPFAFTFHCLPQNPARPRERTRQGMGLHPHTTLQVQRGRMNSGVERGHSVNMAQLCWRLASAVPASIVVRWGMASKPSPQKADPSCTHARQPWDASV